MLITTKNRREELIRTISSLQRCLGPHDELIVLDDGSTDGTLDLLCAHLRVDRVMRHDAPSGLIAARNELLGAARGLYAVILDDDAEFISTSPLREIERAFKSDINIAALAFPIWWGLAPPVETDTTIDEERPVRSWVGCGHAIRLSAWRRIDGYPAWYIFGSEEQHAAMQFFHLGYSVLYIPTVLVHHRVSNSQRKGTAEAWNKYWRGLHAGWCVILTFYPMPYAVRKLFSSMYFQLVRRIIGDRNFHQGRFFLRALMELYINARRLLIERQPFTPTEYEQWLKIKEPVVYWTPEPRS